jgi:hypothetical protein
MFGLSALLTAFARLANAVNSLAATAEQVDGGIRQRLMLDAPEAPATLTTNRLAGPDVQEEAAATNGRKRGKA